MAIYLSRKNIAKYFLSLKNFEVALSYFKEALDISLKMTGAGTNASTEMGACLDLGEAYEANGMIAPTFKKNNKKNNAFARSRKLKKGIGIL